MYKPWSPGVGKGHNNIETKIFFSRTSRPFAIKLGTNISCMVGIQVYSSEGQSPLQRGDNHKSAKIG
jgi:hypothetical protein